MLFLTKVFFWSILAFTTYSTPRELVQAIKNRPNLSLPPTYTFWQETIRFNADGSTRDTTIWYEAVEYPKNFRIDFGNWQNGNANIYRADSVYAFRKKELVKSYAEIQASLLMKGGLHFYDLDTVMSRIAALGIDTTIIAQVEDKGENYYIIGAQSPDEEVPQIWLHAQHFYVWRRTSRFGTDNKYLIVQYGDYHNRDGYWLEEWVEFYLDGQLLQTERYFNIDMKPNLPPDVFNPKAFGQVYWFKKE